MRCLFDWIGGSIFGAALATAVLLPKIQKRKRDKE